MAAIDGDLGPIPCLVITSESNDIDHEIFGIVACPHAACVGRCSTLCNAFPSESCQPADAAPSSGWAVAAPSEPPCI